MKKKYLFIAVLLGTLTLSAFKLTDDIISKLGMEQSNAQYHILANLVGRFSTGAVDNNEPDGNNPMSVYNQLQHFKYLMPGCCHPLYREIKLLLQKNYVRM